jgi:hypothetical protein
VKSKNPRLYELAKALTGLELHMLARWGGRTGGNDSKLNFFERGSILYRLKSVVRRIFTFFIRTK